MADAFPLPAAILPHGHAALWLDGVLEVHTGRFVGLGRVPANCPFVRHGKCQSFTGLELCAQAAGYHTAVAVQHHSNPRRGWLVSVQHLELLLDELSVDSRLRVEVGRQGASGSLVSYGARLWCADRLALQGTLSLFLSD